MKKIISAIIAMAVAATLVIGAVFAAQRLSHKSSSTITYNLKSAYVEITGNYGSDTDKQLSYDEDTTKPKTGDLTWAIPNMEIDEDNGFVEFSITIVNKGANEVTVNINDNTENTFLPTGTELKVSNSLLVDDGGNELDAVDYKSFQEVTLAAEGAANDEDTVVLTFTLSLTNYLTPITAAANFALQLDIEAVAVSAGN